MIRYDQYNVNHARKLRQEMMPWERKLWYMYLRTYPVRFQRQKPVSHYIADFYCAKAKLIVELDGGGHYSCEEIEKDNKRTRELESFGIKVIRFCNRDIDREFYSVCTVIDKEVKSRI